MKALDLVRKVASLRSSFRRPGEAGDAQTGLGRRAAVSAIRVTTSLTRQMQRLPMPRASAAERAALSIAAAPLRAMVDGALVPAVEESSPEAALLELVHETLALVDKLLDADAELTSPAPKAELPAPQPSQDAQRHKVRF